MRIMKKTVAHFVPASSRCAWSLCSRAQSVRNHRHEQFVQNQSRRARPQSQTRAGKLPRGSCHRGPPETEPSSTLAFKASSLKEWWWHSPGGTSPLGQWVWGHRIWSRNSSIPRAGLLGTRRDVTVRPPSPSPGAHLGCSRCWGQEGPAALGELLALGIFLPWGRCGASLGAWKSQGEPKNRPKSSRVPSLESPQQVLGALHLPHPSAPLPLASHPASAINHGQ